MAALLAHSWFTPQYKQCRVNVAAVLRIHVQRTSHSPCIQSPPKHSPNRW